MPEAALASAALKLRACDGEDLKAIAAVVQDALVPVHDMCWLAGESRFVIAMNRFRWEGLAAAEPQGVYERVNSGICFEGVSKAQLRGFSLTERNFILDLLTITYQDGFVLLRFAGHRDVRLTVKSLECRLGDFGEPWPTRSRPKHTAEDEWAEWETTRPGNK